MSMDLTQADVDAITEGVPPGAALSAVREVVLSARTWTEIGFDGLEIYLATDHDVRFLVRKVTLPAADHSPT